MARKRKRIARPQAKTLLQRIAEGIERMLLPPSTARKVRMRSYLGGHRWNR